jgi:S-(hydroxymethyl)mycothiol dehydrogenase
MRAAVLTEVNNPLQILVRGARLAGASPIIACDLRDNKLNYAKTFGATRAINATSAGVVERAREMTGELGVDTAFDAILAASRLLCR